MRQLFQPGEAQKSAAALDGMDRSENAGQQLFGGRVGFQFHQFLVQSVQVLVAFDEKIFNDFVHKLIFAERMLVVAQVLSQCSASFRHPGSCLRNPTFGLYITSALVRTT
jgi:hypothetical protein